ncbi:MAG: hypothetical protein PHT81_04700, partial [Endomicrobiaceae bacterium]|nr:hypothetical protein [Endomicrobiaceae bacterium]
ADKSSIVTTAKTSTKETAKVTVKPYALATGISQEIANVSFGTRTLPDTLKITPQLVTTEADMFGYKKLFAIPIRISGKILKVNVNMSVSDDGSISVLFTLNGNSKKMFDAMLKDKSSEEIQKITQELTDMYTAAYYGRLSSDGFARQKFLKYVLSERFTFDFFNNTDIAKFKDDIEKAYKESIENLGKYSNDPLFKEFIETEINQSIVPAGRKEVDVKMTKLSNLIKTLEHSRNSGVTAINLDADDLSQSDTITAIRIIRDYGLDVNIVVNIQNVTDVNAEIEKINYLKGLTGVRFISDGSTSQIEQMVPEFDFALVPNISIDFSNESNNNINKENIHFINKNNKKVQENGIGIYYELVLNFDKMSPEVKKDENSLEDYMNEYGITELIKNGNFIPKFDSDKTFKEKNIIAQRFLQSKNIIAIAVEKSIAKSSNITKQIIYGNKIKQSYNRGMSVELYDAFNANTDFTSYAKILGDKTLSFDKLKEIYKNEISQQLTDIAKNAVESILYTEAEENLTDAQKTEKVSMVRQLLSGMISSYAEREVFSKLLSEREINISEMNTSDRKYIRYLTTQLLISDISVEDIINRLGNIQHSKILSLTEIKQALKFDITRVLKDLNVSDVIIEPVAKSQVAKTLENIDTILASTDRLLDVNALNKSLSVSVDGVKGILSAA